MLKILSLFLSEKFVWRHLKMTLSYRAGQYGHLDTLNSKIRLLVMILSIFFQKNPQKFFQFHFSPPWRQWRHLKMFLSYWASRYGNLDTLNSKIRPLQQILEIYGEKSEEQHQEQEQQQQQQETRSTCCGQKNLEWQKMEYLYSKVPLDANYIETLSQTNANSFHLQNGRLLLDSKTSLLIS